jgi:hypothetical protein
MRRGTLFFICFLLMMFKLDAYAVEQNDGQDSLKNSEAQSTPNAFNPSISLIISGIYSNTSLDPANYRITGFERPVDKLGNPVTDIGPSQIGFGITETELAMNANVDPWFSGSVNIAMKPDNTISIEEAFFQTTALPNGLTVKAGRFFPAIGYLNEQHAHTWDFVDNPLAYMAFLGTQLGEDGIQANWVMPTDIFLEFGGLVGRGKDFPGTSTNNDGVGSGGGYLHLGGELGDENSWRLGASTFETYPVNEYFQEYSKAGALTQNSFIGRSRLYIADLVWKWAPHGNAVYTSFKLQGEYLQSNGSGTVTYDTAQTNSAAAFTSAQSGWYLQAVYKFMKEWRIGVRYDQLDSGNLNYGANNQNIQRYSYLPSKATVMLDYSLSEFSRFRLQYAQDNSRQSATDNQFFVQYQLSLGAHGAHKF